MNLTLRTLLPLCAALAAGTAQGQSHSAYIGGAYIDIHSSAPALAGGPACPPRAP